MLNKNLLVLICALILAPPAASFAQGNNMDIYNKILRDNNHPSQKQWQKEEAEAPMLDIDAIVRREQEQRRRQQAPQQRARTPACREGAYVSQTGCGNFGIDSCCCINGQLLPCRAY